MKYEGLSYEQCSREALRLLTRRATQDGKWWDIVDDLVALRARMLVLLPSVGRQCA